MDGDEAASEGPIISGKSRDNEGMALVTYCTLPNGKWLLGIASDLRRR